MSDEVLGPAIDEVRWQHPELRVACCAFMGPSIVVLAESRPAAMPSMGSRRPSGEPVASLVELLETGDEFVVPQVWAQVGWRSISRAILGEETLATAFVPIRLEGDLVGFLRLDSPRVGPIKRSAVEALHDVAPVAALAIALELERSRNEARDAQVEQLHASICLQAARQREVGHELHRGMQSLRRMVERVGAGLEPTARIEVDTIIRRFAGTVDAAMQALTEASDGARPRLSVLSEIAPGSGRSTGETRG